METALQHLVIALHAAQDAGAPEWLQLVPAGTFKGVDGRGPFRNDRPGDVVALFNAEARKLPIDENHSTELASKIGLPSPARGWIVELDVRDGSIWGRAEWTESGAAMMSDRAYGFLSPVFLHPKEPPYHVVKLTSVALTNDPNLTQLKSLHSKQESDMLEQLRKALGLPDDADEAAVMAAVAASRNAQLDLARITTAAGADAQDVEQLVRGLQSARNGDDPNEITVLKDQVKALHNQLSAYVTVTSQDKAVAAIDKAIGDGKVFPALREHYIARHVKNAEEVEKEIALLPSLHAGGLGGRKIDPAKDAPDQGETQVAALMGVDPDAYAKTRAKLFGKDA